MPHKAVEIERRGGARIGLHRGDFGALAGDGAGLFQHTAGLFPVSYTHLDVYKRQVLAIRDDGPGMSAEQIAHACEIGTRFDPAMPGSGLGLAIARDIAESYGLALRLGPGPEGGLVAEIRFPA